MLDLFLLKAWGDFHHRTGYKATRGLSRSTRGKLSSRITWDVEGYLWRKNWQSQEAREIEKCKQGKSQGNSPNWVSAFFVCLFFPIGHCMLNFEWISSIYAIRSKRGPFVMEDTGRNWYLVILLKTVFAFRRPKVWILLLYNSVCHLWNILWKKEIPIAKND